MSEVKECRLCQRLVQPEREPVGCLRVSVALLLAVPTFGLTLLIFLFQPQRCPICHSNQLQKPVGKGISVSRDAQVSAQVEKPKFLTTEKGRTEFSSEQSDGGDNKRRGQSLLVSDKPRSLAPLWISIAVLFVLGLSFIVGGQKREQKRTAPPFSTQKSLIEAAGNGDITTVQALLAKGADPNEKDRFGTTALMFAARNGHTTIVQMLLDKGADGYARNVSKETALDMASAKGHTQIVKLLAQASVVGTSSPLIVTVDKANVRSGPGEKYGIVGYGKRGDAFDVKGQEGDWYKVDYQGQDAWIHKTIVAEPLEVQAEEQCTIKIPFGERKIGLLAISEGLDAALASQDPQRLAPYVLCALNDGDKVAVDVRGKAVARVRVLSSRGCTPGEQGIVLAPMLNCKSERQGKPSKDRPQQAQRKEPETHS